MPSKNHKPLTWADVARLAGQASKIEDGIGEMELAIAVSAMRVIQKRSAELSRMRDHLLEEKNPPAKVVDALRWLPETIEVILPSVAEFYQLGEVEVPHRGPTIEAPFHAKRIDEHALRMLRRSADALIEHAKHAPAAIGDNRITMKDLESFLEVEPRGLDRKQKGWPDYCGGKGVKGNPKWWRRSIIMPAVQTSDPMRDFEKFPIGIPPGD